MEGRSVIPSLLFGCALLAGCTLTETIGVADTGVGDTESTGTAGDTATVDTSPPSFSRVPYMPPDAAADDLLWMAPEDNVLGMRGTWWVFSDFSSQVAIHNAGNQTICTTGTVNAYTGEGWTYAGIGFSMCNNGAVEEEPWLNHTLGECPFVADMEDKILGVSFEVSGTLPDDLFLHFKEPGQVHPVGLPVLAGERRDYFIANSIAPEGEPATVVADIDAIQFHVDNIPDAQVPFDFCIHGVQMLVAE